MRCDERCDASVSCRRWQAAILRISVAGGLGGGREKEMKKTWEFSESAAPAQRWHVPRAAWVAQDAEGG